LRDALLFVEPGIGRGRAGFGVLFVDVGHLCLPEIPRAARYLRRRPAGAHFGGTPHRGKRNEPAYTAHTARVGAEVFGMDYADFAAQTQANFERLFTKAAA